MTDIAHIQDGNLRVALATWITLMGAREHTPDDPELAEAISRVLAAEDAETGDAAGLALIERVAALVDEAGEAPDAVAGLAGRLFGEAVSTDLGAGSREERLQRIRHYQFERGLPWLARIYERREDGTVAPSWLLVERVTDRVNAMDPNPWDDIDEERTLPVADFQVLWELDGCTSLRLTA
jgi:hypothetical protein